MLKPTAVVELIWQDETGSTSSSTINCLSSATYAEIDASASALASIVASMTGCVLVRQRIKYTSVPDSPPVASGSAPITRTGVFYFSVDPPSPDGLLIVHSIREGVITDVEPFAGVGIDRDNSDVVAFRDAVLTAGCTNPFGDAFTALVAAYLQSRV